MPHHVETVGNHNQDDADIFGKRDKQVAEVLRLNGRTLGIKFIDAYQSANDACHVLPELFLYPFRRVKAPTHTLMEHDAQDGSTLHADFLCHDDSCFHILDDGVQSEDIAPE